VTQANQTSKFFRKPLLRITAHP